LTGRYRRYLSTRLTAKGFISTISPDNTMRRRRLLAVAVGAAGTLGTVAVAADRPSGPPATRAEDPVPRAVAWDHPVVATDVTTVGTDRYGTVDQRASVFDLPASGRYASVVGCRLVPGSNYHAGTGWKTVSLTVDHEWRSGTLVAHRGDVVPAEDEDDAVGVLRTARSETGYRWEFAFDTPTGNTRSYRFVTVGDRETAPDRGETLVEATVGGGFEKRFGMEERDVASADLAFGRTDG
jgi:hypothetical protein